MDFIWDIHQDGRINSAQSEAREAGDKADAVVSEFARMQRRLDRLSLGCQAMWELMRDRGWVTEEELRAKILEVDLRDGTTDGRMSTQITDCPKCGAKTNSKRSTCVMCGAPLEVRHSFEV
jgi:hypothetical protein